MQKIIILLISLFATANAFAQYTPPICGPGQTMQCNNYPSYQYDAAGNRTSKFNFCWCVAADSRLANQVKDSTKTDDTQAAATQALSQQNTAAAISKIFPNPTNSTITVLFSENISKGLLAISDATGKQIEAFPINSAEVKIDISQYPAGAYFLTLRTAAAVNTQRIVKIE